MNSSKAPSAIPSSSATGGWTTTQLEEALRRVGIVGGDTVFFQVCAEALGPAQGGPDDAELAARMLDALRGVVGGQGTILAPTYTFSFCRGEEYDPARAKTRPGPWNTFTAFPEHLRSLPGAIRSGDPIFSVAGIGPRAEELLTKLPRTCLGEGSLHDRLRRAGGKIAILGVGLYEAIFRHHVEAVARVPWRYDKLFTGWVREAGTRRKEGWIYNVRILAPNGDPAGEALEALARRAGTAKSAPVGGGELVAVEADAFFRLTAAELAKDPWSTAKGPPGDPRAIEDARTSGPAAPARLPDGASMREIIDGLWQLPRDILSNGYDAALGALARQVPMTIHEYPTGTECWTWIVPEKWTCREAYLETMDGRRLFSYADHPLHVVSYSLPFEGVVSREELFRHLHVHGRLRDAIPFQFKYYERDWGLCCSQEQKEALTDDRYRVVIRTDFSMGSVKVGEILIPGRSEDTIVLCVHLCHPHMVNDDLTGIAVAIDVARALRSLPERRYTYRILIVPETIGTVAYLSHHEELIPKMKGGLFLEMLGKDHPHSLQSSMTGVEEVDLCFQEALRERDPQGWVGAYRTVIGNDERQFNGPGVRVPFPSLSRVLPPTHPDYPYREYHTSHDTPAILSEGALEASRDLVLRMLEVFEQNRTPVNKFRGEVFCARYGIHRNWYTDREGHRALFSTMHLIDGTRSMARIAREAGVSFAEVRRAIQELEHHGLVELL
jgi:aminopeptidase-like protein/aminoglycoside N3'-acetyltransferase